MLPWVERGTRAGLVLLLTMALSACAQRRIGEFSAVDHAYAGRPREALEQLERERRGASELPLHRGMLLHAAGDFEASARAWAEVSDTAELHEIERTMLDRLRLLNRAVLSQDVSAVAPLLDATEVSLATLGPDQAAILVFVEQGWAPSIRGGVEEGQASVVAGPPPGSALVRLDDGPATEAKLLHDDADRWSAATVQRFEDKVQTSTNLVDLSGRVNAARRAGNGWWTAPTRLLFAEIVTRPGDHVILIPTARGLRERAVTLVAGQRLIVVTRS